MANYSYSQLEALWIQAGGPQAVAPLMAAIALAESSGNPDNNNYNDSNGSGGTQTSWGLWQISNGTHDAPVANIDSPLVNAQQAVAKYETQGLSAWGTYTSGAYKQYFNGDIPPSANIGGSNAASGSQLTASDSNSLDPSVALNEMGTLFHGIASALNFGFWFFEPGQGWRFVLGVGGVASGVAAAKLYTSPSVSTEKSAAFPAAILFTGVSLLCLYMTLRAWPVDSSGKALRPANYAVMIIKGKKPPAGPAAPDNTNAIQGGLEAIAGLWVVNKAASTISGLAGAAGILGGIWAAIKGAFGGGGGSGEAPPEIPEVASLTVPTVPGLAPTSGTTQLV